MQMLVNMLCGVLPEMIYFYVFIKILLGIKNKKALLFVIISISYILSTLIVDCNLYLYILFYILVYIGLRVSKKPIITDFFLIIFLEVYLYATSGLCYFCIPNYIIAFIVNRIMIFIPLLFKKQLIKLYENYKSLWNKRENATIKSLTLRNISLIVINALIILAYTTLLYISRIS